MRAHNPFSAIFGLMLVHAAAASGHAQVRGSGHGIPSTAVAVQTGCGLCHGMHATNREQANLVTGAPRASFRYLSGVSQSCLRCHSTADVRASDPLFAGYRSRNPPGSLQSFLGDLSDDHPIARTDGQPDLRRRTARWVASPLANQRRRVPLEPTEVGALPECTACHEIHSGPDPALTDNDQQSGCLECHESATYLTDHVELSCTGCHTMHGGKGIALVREPTTDLLCQSCHDPAGGGRLQTGIVPPLMPGLQRHGTDGLAATPGTCLSCHAVHASR